MSQTRTVRWTLGLTAFLTTLLLGLCGLTLTLIGNVFDQFEQSVQQDLAWKALGVPHEIAGASARAIRDRDQQAILRGQLNPDVEAVVVVDPAGVVLASRGRAAEEVVGLFQGPPDTVLAARTLRAWTSVALEGGEVGKVAASISTRRLDVLAAFRERVLLLAAGGTVTALVASMLFAGFYLGPLLRRRAEPPPEEKSITEEPPELARIAELERALAQASRRAQDSTKLANALGAPQMLQEVGNALTGVNVSAGVVADTVRASRLAGLEKVLALIEANAEDLAGFLRDDPKGRRLPEYLRALAKASVEERATIAREIASVQAKVARIKEIVGGRASTDDLDEQAG
jgi:hypothetical protein